MMVAAMIAVAIGAWSPVITLASSYLFVSDNGSVGIGNVDPQAKLDVSGAIYSRLVSVTNSSTIDWSQGNIQEITLSSNTTLTFTNGVPGAEYKLILKQDSAGGRTVAWPQSVKWLVQGSPSVSTGANMKDVASFVYDGADYLGTFAAAAGQSGGQGGGGQGGGQSGECTGGTITHASGNTIHTFTDVGTSTFNCANAGGKTVSYLVVAGGGGGGNAGGGAGGVREGTLAVDAQSYSVTVGAGGLGQSTTQTRTNGENSAFASIILSVEVQAAMHRWVAPEVQAVEVVAPSTPVGVSTAQAWVTLEVKPALMQDHGLRAGVVEPVVPGIRAPTS